MVPTHNSNAAVVLAEEMFEAGLHWVAIDPKGDWWGVRSSRDGKGPGLPVPIFGGQRGDLPLDPDAGAYLADLIVDNTLTCVLDLSEFTEGDKIRFLAGAGGKDGFAARLYKRKQPTQAPTHIFLEEADDYLPQRFGKDKAKLLHDCSRLILWGRQRGIGATFISQRSARINKDVLTQAETLLVLRTAAPQDIGAVKDWVKYHGVAEELLGSLSSLENGEAWIWSPHWLKKIVKVQFRQRSTFDSGSTPLVGGKRHGKPATLADVDIAAVKEKMAATIEKAKAEDPRELRKKVADLERKLGEAGKGKPAADAGGKEFERGYEKGKREAARAAAAAQAGKEKAIRELLNRTRRKVMATLAALGEEPTGEIDAALEALKAEAAPVADVYSHEPVRPEGHGARSLREQLDEAQSRIRNERTAERPRPTTTGANGFGKGERKILAAIAQYPEGATREQLTVLTGYKRSSRDTYLQRLSAAGYVESRGAGLGATGEGVAALGPDFEALPTGAELRRYWMERLTAGERAILGILIEKYPNSVEREFVSEATGYKRSSRDTYVQRLQSRKLVKSTGRGELTASDELF